jgi:hypothetical protein
VGLSPQKKAKELFENYEKWTMQQRLEFVKNDVDGV